MSQLGTLTSALLVPGHRQGCVTAPISDYKAWHGFGSDHLAFSQLLPLVREKQLCQGLLLVSVVALLLWRVRA